MRRLEGRNLVNPRRTFPQLLVLSSLITGLALAAPRSAAQSPPPGAPGSEQTAREEIEKALDEAAKEVARGDCGSALPRLQSILSSSAETPKALYLLGFCQAAQGQADQSLTTLDRLVALKPAFPGLRLLRGQVFRVLGRAGEAETELKAQIETGNDPQVLPDAWFTLGIVYRDSGRRADAVSAFEQASALAPNRTDAILELADLHMKLDQLDRAEEALEKARQAGAQTITRLLNVGVAFFNGKNYERSVAVFSRVIEMGGDPSELGAAYALLAKSQIRQGNTSEAVTSFKKSLELDPLGRYAEESRKQLEALSARTRK